MKRPLLACLLAAALALSPSTARADSISGVELALAVGPIVLVAGTVETLTGVATYKNLRAASRDEKGSTGWVTVGALGGLVNAGLGGLAIYAALPSDYEDTCMDEKSSRAPSGELYVGSHPCAKRTETRPGTLAMGVLLIGIGVLATGSAIAAWNSGGSGESGAPGAAAAPAAVSLALPAIAW